MFPSLSQLEKQLLMRCVIAACAGMAAFLVTGVSQLRAGVRDLGYLGSPAAIHTPTPIVLAKLSKEEKLEKKKNKLQKQLKQLQKKLQQGQDEKSQKKLQKKKDKKQRHLERVEKQLQQVGKEVKFGELVVDISDAPDPAVKDGEVKYQIKVKNNSPVQSFDVWVEVPLPNGTTFVRCTTSTGGNCQAVGTKVTATFAVVKAHATATVSLTLRMPPFPTEIKVPVTAGGENVFKDSRTESTIVLAPSASALLLQDSDSLSGQETVVNCGQTIDSSFLGSYTVLRLLETLSCGSVPFGLRVSASGVTLDLNRQKILGAVGKGNVGLSIGAGAAGVTIDGGSTKGSSGIEHFDYCLRAEGGNAGLEVRKLRCFRARSTGFDLLSDDVKVSNSLVDKTTPSSGATEEPPGGVGIWARGDNIYIDGTIVRRSENVGVWSVGSNVTINGGRIEKNAGIGLYLNGANNLADGVKVRGDGSDTGTSMDGVVVGPSGDGNVLNHVSVKQHRGNGIVLEGTDNLVEGSTVEDVGIDGYVLKGSGNVLNGNKVSVEGNGYVNQGPDNTLTSNTAEQVGGSGYVVTQAGARAVLEGNDAKLSGLHGFLLQGGDVFANSNLAEECGGNGFDVPGNGHTLENNDSQLNTGIGYNITGVDNLLDTNFAEKNGDVEFFVGPGNSGNGNKANGDRISITDAGGAFE